MIQSISKNQLNSKYLPTASKIIIWDLGDTLFTPDTFGIMREIGLSNFLLYSLIDFQDPTKIQDLIFTILKTECPDDNHKTIFTSEGKILPAIMCNWLEGSESAKEIYQKAILYIQKYESNGNFISSRQKELIEKTLNIMFDPAKLAQYMKPIKSALNILEKCMQPKDIFGNQKNILFLLSNFDSESFNCLLNSGHGKILLKYFKPENIIISGDVKMVKPYPTIYQYLINKFNINPSDCIFVDDQKENIETAQKLGMTGIHLEKNNYKKLQFQLEELNVF